MCKQVSNNEWGKFLGFETLTYVPYEKEAIIPERFTEREKQILNEYNTKIYELYSDKLNEEEKKWLKTVTEIIE